MCEDTKLQLHCGDDFNGKSYVVAGADSGVGGRVVTELASRGAKVVAGCRTGVESGVMLDEAAQIGSVHRLDFDLSDPESCSRLVRSARETLGRVDGLFCYAGVTWASRLDECDDDHVAGLLTHNVTSTVALCRAAIQEMRLTGGGSIVLTGSPHGHVGEIDRAIYACSKSVLPTLARHIARHYAKHSIRANVLVLGWTPTEGELKFRAEQGVSELELRAMAAHVIPAGRMVEVSDVWPLVLFLLSSESAMISGSEMHATGGWFL